MNRLSVAMAILASVGVKSACADVVTIHAEAVADPRSVLAEIRRLGAAAGVAINPDTPLERLRGVVGGCDLVLIMSVPAGFGGQSFRREALDRLRIARDWFGPDVLLEVDGGVNEQTIADCSAAGAQLFVVGSALFRASDYAVAVQQLTKLASDAPPSQI